jgi:ATP-binding protein involved in chromosome partitioning
MDPRVQIIGERLKGVERIIAVSGGKGGVGKSSFAAALALVLSEKRHKVGLLDLDFWGPSVHVIFGRQGVIPEEDKGIIPPSIHGIECMSISYYTVDKALALRKSDFEDAVIELLAVTRWGELDYLIIDMPPGIGDAALDVVRIMKKVRFCIITTQSALVMETVAKTMQILSQLRIPIVGVIQNMKTKDYPLEGQFSGFNAPFLGQIPFDPGFEAAIGDPEKLLRTDFVKHVKRAILTGIEKHFPGKNIPSGEEAIKGG